LRTVDPATWLNIPPPLVQACTVFRNELLNLHTSFFKQHNGLSKLHEKVVDTADSLEHDCVSRMENFKGATNERFTADAEVVAQAQEALAEETDKRLADLRADMVQLVEARSRETAEDLSQAYNLAIQDAKASVLQDTEASIRQLRKEMHRSMAVPGRVDPTIQSEEQAKAKGMHKHLGQYLRKLDKDLREEIEDSSTRFLAFKKAVGATQVATALSTADHASQLDANATKMADADGKITTIMEELEARKLVIDELNEKLTDVADEQLLELQT